MPSKRKSQRETCEEEDALTFLDGATDEGFEDDTRQRLGLRGAIFLRKRCHMRCGVRRIVLCAALASMVLVLLMKRYLPTEKPERSIAGWPMNTSRDIKNYIWPYRESALIAPRDFCHQKALVIISINSAMENFVLRQKIRETWGNTTEFNYEIFAKVHAHLKSHYLEPTAERLKLYARYLSGKGATLSAKVRIVFIVGRSKDESKMPGNKTRLHLHNEAIVYNDIIQEDFVDSYNNLTLKSVMAMKYISRHCSKSSAFYLKADDDTFVNVPNLIHFLLGGTVPVYDDTLEYYDLVSIRVMSSENQLSATKEIMRGYMFCHPKPQRPENRKWYMPYYMYPPALYPNYLSGAGYLMSMDVVTRLYEAALNTTLIHMEDAYVTGMCADRARIKRVHNSLFRTTYSDQWCVSKGIILQHYMKEDRLTKAWQFVMNFSIECAPAGRYFKQKRLRKRTIC